MVHWWACGVHWQWERWGCAFGGVCVYEEMNMYYISHNLTLFGVLEKWICGVYWEGWMPSLHWERWIQCASEGVTVLAQVDRQCAYREMVDKDGHTEDCYWGDCIRSGLEVVDGYVVCITYGHQKIFVRIAVIIGRGGYVEWLIMWSPWGRHAFSADVNPFAQAL